MAHTSLHSALQEMLSSFCLPCELAKRYLLYTELSLNSKSPPETYNTSDQTQNYVNIGTDILDSAHLALHFLRAQMRNSKYTYRTFWRLFLIPLILPPLTNSTCIHTNVCKRFLGEGKRSRPYSRVILLVYPCYFLCSLGFLG